MSGRTGAARVPEACVRLAGHLADAAGAVLGHYFRSRLLIDSKADSSPVSRVDRDAEAAMRRLINAEAPDHGIWGEEHGVERADADYVWVLDPLDGTKSYVTGKPLFGTLIGLAHRGEPVLGIIDQPVLGERWVGVAGRPTLYNGKRTRTRACARLDKAWLYATTPRMFKGRDRARFERLCKRVRHDVYGAECYAYGLLALGFVDLVAEADLKPYDYCALVPVVRGAGGAITDWRGRALTLHSDGRVLAAGDKRMHRLALRALAA